MSTSNHTLGTVYTACADLGITPETARKIKTTRSASDVRALWDYRARGLTIDTARDAIHNALARYSNYPSPRMARSRRMRDDYAHRYGAAYVTCSPRVSDYRVRIARRKGNRETIARAHRATAYSDINDRLGGYGHGYSVAVHITDGRCILINRHEDVQWGDNPRRHWPTSRSTSYSATLYSAQRDVVATRQFAARTGDWLGAMATALGLPTAKRSKITLTAANQIVSDRMIAGYRVIGLSPLGSTLRLWCVVAPDGTTYHADARRDLMQGLRDKLGKSRAGIRAHNQPIDMALCLSLGFCRAGVTAAAHALRLNPEGRYHAQQVYEAVQRDQRAAAPYEDELRQLASVVGYQIPEVAHAN